jgi:hypothetical protein
MSPQTPLVIQFLRASRTPRLAIPLCASVILFVGALRAGDELPSPGIQSSPGHWTEVLADGAVKPPARFEVSASFLFLQASNSNPVYATVTHPYPDLTPHWDNRAINGDFHPAFNVGFLYLLDGGGDVRLGWTHLNSYDDGSTVSTFPLPAATGIPPANLPPATQSLNPPYLVGPPLPFAVAASVLHSAYDAVDLEAGPTFNSGNWRMRAFAGLQYAHIGQRLSTDFQTFDGSFAFRDVSDARFDGVGPRGGVDVSLTAGRLELSGGFAGSGLIGQRASSIDFLSASPQTRAAGIPLNVQSLTSPHTTSAIPGINARLGAGYSFPVASFGVLRCDCTFRDPMMFMPPG